MKIFKFSGIIDGWKIVHGEVTATDLSEAKKKFRTNFKGVKSLIQE